MWFSHVVGECQKYKGMCDNCDLYVFLMQNIKNVIEDGEKFDFEYLEKVLGEAN